MSMSMTKSTHLLTAVDMHLHYKSKKRAHAFAETLGKDAQQFVSSSPAHGERATAKSSARLYAGVLAGRTRA